MLEPPQSCSPASSRGNDAAAISAYAIRARRSVRKSRGGGRWSIEGGLSIPAAGGDRSGVRVELGGPRRAGLVDEVEPLDDVVQRRQVGHRGAVPVDELAAGEVALED